MSKNELIWYDFYYKESYHKRKTWIDFWGGGIIICDLNGQFLINSQLELLCKQPECLSSSNGIDSVTIIGFTLTRGLIHLHVLQQFYFVKMDHCFYTFTPTVVMSFLTLLLNVLYSHSVVWMNSGSLGRVYCRDFDIDKNYQGLLNNLS